jgi:hypothetical protein
VFLLVANDSGGDSPAAVREFAKSSGTALPLAYDGGGNLHRALGFTGVPALVVIDRTGTVRLVREGYNEADSGFRSDLVSFVSGL